MRRVKMITRMAGPGINANENAEISVDDKQAADLIKGGYAEYIDEAEAKKKPARKKAAKKETAASKVAADAETAVDKNAET